MTPTDGSPDHCDICGHLRSSADRYCAGCGAQLTEVRHVAGRRRDSIVGLGVLAGLIALAAFAFVWSGSPDAESEDAASDAATTPAAIVPTATPAPTATATPAATPIAEASDESSAAVAPALTPRPSPTPRPTPTPKPELLDALAGLDLGTGWLVTMDNDRHPTALNLENGEQVTITEPVPRGHQMFVTADGAYATARFQLDALRLLGSWSGEPVAPERETPLPSDHQIVAAFTDPDRGTIVVSTPKPPRDADEYAATALATNETQTITAQAAAVDHASGLWPVFRDTANHPEPLPSWVVDIGGATWSWDWSDGWSKVADGTIVTRHDDAVVVRRCDSPTDCVLELAAVDGSGIRPLAINPARQLWSISPDRTTAVRPLNGPSDAAVALVDLETERELAIGGGDLQGTQPLWSPNSEVVMMIDFGGNVAVFDATTGESVASFTNPSPLTFDNRGQPIVFLPTLNR